MKITSNTQLSREDFPEAPNWISKLLYPLQLFITEVRTALINQLSFQDNFSCVIKQLPIRAGTLATDNIVTFPYSLGRQPIEMTIHVVRQDGVYEVVYPQVSWNYVNNNIVVNGISGLTTGKIYLVTFVVK
jgi:hypothetical protein